MSNIGETVNFLAAIGCAHAILTAHAKDMEGKTAVTDVTHWFDVYERDFGSEVAEFVSAELEGGDALDWRLEIRAYHSPSRITVEADVRRTLSEHYEVVASVADAVFETFDDCASAIRDIAERLCSIIPVNR